MNIIYYSEVNLICILILLLFANQMRYNSGRFSDDNRTFNAILRTTIIMCVSDMVAGILRGQLFSGARVLIVISNLIFYEAILVVSFLWMAYVFKKLRLIKNKKELLPYAIPFLIFTVVIVLNPLTHWLFSIDENNLYTRGVGVYFHWLVSWGYLIAATVITAVKIIREKDKNKRREIIPLIYFIVSPAVAAVIQMRFYGITCSQVGITLSIVFISLMTQNTKMLTDTLTGLYNRYGFAKYWEEYMQRHTETTLCLMMIDINDFKQVNDKYGHLEGDKALADVADAVKRSCEETDALLFACRYGGDEFLIAGCDCGEAVFYNLKTRINKKLEEKNRTEKYPYLLSVSIGMATGKCVNSKCAEDLMKIADDNMYAEKRRLKSSLAETH